MACQQLLSDGFNVVGLTRNPDQAKEASSKVEWASKVSWVGGDLKKPETLKTAFAGVDKVIFAAGAHAYEEGIANNKRCVSPFYAYVNALPCPEHGFFFFYSIFADSVGELAKLSKEAGVSRFVLVSSAGVTHLEAFAPRDYLYDCLK